MNREMFSDNGGLFHEESLDIARLDTVRDIVRKQILGQIERHDFLDEYPEQLALEARRSINKTEFTQRNDILNTKLPRGTVDPLVIPDVHRLRGLNEEDWYAIANHEQPIMAIWSKARLHQVRVKEKLENEANQGRIIGDEQRQFREISFLASLPLLHRTTIKGLRRILKSGQMYSHRAVNERGRKKTLGNTISWDKELGLDNYVFADFGKLNTYQIIDPEVIIAISPLALTQPGSFLTEKDKASCNITEYFAGLSLPEDFYETALRRIRSSPSLSTYRENGMELHHYLTVPGFAMGDNADPITRGSKQGSFSTWEVKIPEVPVEFIDEIVFKDKSKYQRFVAHYGGSIPVVYKPDLGSSMDVLQDFKIKAEVYKRLTAGNHQRSSSLMTQDPRENQ